MLHKVDSIYDYALPDFITEQFSDNLLILEQLNQQNPLDIYVSSDLTDITQQPETKPVSGLAVCRLEHNGLLCVILSALTENHELEALVSLYPTATAVEFYTDKFDSPYKELGLSFVCMSKNDVPDNELFQRIRIDDELNQTIVAKKDDEVIELGVIIAADTVTGYLPDNQIIFAIEHMEKLAQSHNRVVSALCRTQHASEILLARGYYPIRYAWRMPLIPSVVIN